MKIKLILLTVLFFLYSIISYANEEYVIEAETVEYNHQKNLINASGKAIAKNSSNKKILSDKISYDKNSKTITTNGNSKYIDSKITISAENFFYHINSKVIEAKNNVIIVDGSNKYTFDNFKYFENEDKGFGANMRVYFSDGSYLEAKKGERNGKKNQINLVNAKYTTCSNILNNKDEYCPTWTLDSNKVKHDKIKKKIVHKNAFLKLKNIPILFTPYVSHPDPTVKRQSGFMPPLIKTISNIGKTVRLPYFIVLSEDKDLTLTPIFYFNEKNTILSSYRQALKNGFLNIEAGYSGGYKRLEKTERTKGSRNYFFLDYNSKKENILFKENELKFKLERISQKNFTRVNKINTKLFNEDIQNLENSFKITSYNENKRLELRAGIFENLDTQNNDKYTYYLPDGIFSLTSKKNKKFNLNLNSFFRASKFYDDQKQGKLTNSLDAQFNQMHIKNLGVGTVLKLNLLNKNTFNRNVNNLKQNESIDNYFTVALDNSIPLAKFSKNSYQILTPRTYLKYTSGKQADARNNSKILNYSDVFSMNRINSLDVPETGFSIGNGIDYSIVNSSSYKNSKTFKLSSGIGQVIRTARNDKLPTTSSLNNTSSDYSGYLKLNIFSKNKKLFNEGGSIEKKPIDKFDNNGVSINYDYNLANDLKKINRNKISLQTIYNDFDTLINFDEKNNHIGNERNAKINIKKYYNKFYYLSFETKKNLLNDNSEYHNFSFNFENDCLSSSLTLSKNFYYDQDLSSSKSLIFNITIKPFSNSIAPDLTSFIN